MAVVRVLPAKSESAVVDRHDEYDLLSLEVSLMMRDIVSNVPNLLTAVAGRQDQGADAMAQ